jgi:hypothetical protein
MVHTEYIYIYFGRHLVRIWSPDFSSGCLIGFWKCWLFLFLLLVLVSYSTYPLFFVRSCIFWYLSCEPIFCVQLFLCGTHGIYIYIFFINCYTNRKCTEKSYQISKKYTTSELHRTPEIYWIAITSIISTILCEKLYFLIFVLLFFLYIFWLWPVVAVRLIGKMCSCCTLSMLLRILKGSQLCVQQISFYCMLISPYNRPRNQVNQVKMTPVVLHWTQISSDMEIVLGYRAPWTLLDRLVFSSGR